VQHYRAAFGWYDQNGNLQVYNSLPGVQNDPSAGMNEGLADHKWIGKFGLDYHVTPQNMVYGSWSLGFRGSAFNAAAVIPSALNGVKPETLIDYEVGTKNQFFDRTLEVNFAGFYYIYRNQQFATLNPVTGLSNEYNLPKVNSRGLELDVIEKPIRGLTLDLSGGYLYATYGSGIVGGVDISGNQVEVSPRWSASASVDWRFLDLDWVTADLYVDGQAITKQYFNANDTAPSLEPGRAVFDWRLTAEFPDEHDLAVSFWMNNMFDAHYETVLYDETSLLNYTNAQRGNPRDFGVQATIRF
jgi:iron complex outermembrane receptor protein